MALQFEWDKKKAELNWRVFSARTPAKQERRTDEEA